MCHYLEFFCLWKLEIWIENLLYWRYRFWIENLLILDFHFWLHFVIGQQRIAAANLKKSCTYQRGSLYNRVGMCSFGVFIKPSVPFFNAVSEEPRWYVILSIAVVQPHLYLQYFLSRLNQTRLYNRACKPYTTAINYLFSTSVKRWFPKIIMLSLFSFS